MLEFRCTVCAYLHTAQRPKTCTHTDTHTHSLTLSPTDTFTPQQSQSFVTLILVGQEPMASGQHRGVPHQHQHGCLNVTFGQVQKVEGVLHVGPIPLHSRTACKILVVLHCKQKGKEKHLMGCTNGQLANDFLTLLLPSPPCTPQTPSFFVLFLNITNMCECVSEGYVIMMGARF